MLLIIANDGYFSHESVFNCLHDIMCYYCIDPVRLKWTTSRIKDWHQKIWCIKSRKTCINIFSKLFIYLKPRKKLNIMETKENRWVLSLRFKKLSGYGQEINKVKFCFIPLRLSGLCMYMCIFGFACDLVLGGFCGFWGPFRCWLIGLVFCFAMGLRDLRCFLKQFQ